jgi:hypothetical protein
MKTRIVKAVGITGVDFSLSVFEMIELKKRVNAIKAGREAIDNGMLEGGVVAIAHCAADELAVFVDKLCFDMSDIVKDCEELFQEPMA